MNCSWTREKVLKMYAMLRKVYTPQPEDFIAWKLILDRSNPFEILVGIVLSQNTSDKNALAAFKNLKSFIGSITPEKIMSLDSNTLASLIRPAGMHTRRAIVLKELAYRLNQLSDKFFEELGSLDVEIAREKLLTLPGIGPKTADVFLLMYLDKPTYPVDTHNARVLYRLGVVDRKDYEYIRRRMLELIGEDVEILRELHILIIEHGRNTCRARAPSCNACVLRELCCRRI